MEFQCHPKPPTNVRLSRSGTFTLGVSAYPNATCLSTSREAPHRATFLVKMITSPLSSNCQCAGVHLVRFQFTLVLQRSVRQELYETIPGSKSTGDHLMCVYWKRKAWGYWFVGREWEKKDVTVTSWFLKTFLHRDLITLLLLNEVFLPWNSKHTGLRFGGKGKQTDFFFSI